MRYILIIGVIISSCQLAPNYNDYPIFNTAHKFENVVSMQTWVYLNSVYVTDKVKFNNIEYWQSPYEFERNNFNGDCEDWAIYLGALYYANFGIKPEFASIIFENGGAHFVTKINNLFYDPINNTINTFHVGNIYGEKIIKINYYEFDYVMWISYNTHCIKNDAIPYYKEIL